MQLFTFLKLLRQKFFSKKESDYASFVIAKHFASFCYPRMIFSEYGRLWLADEEFFERYRKFEPDNCASADRKYFLRSLLSLVDALPGDTAECGAYRGASSWFICDKFKDSGKTHFIFDSFAGLSEPALVDGEYWTRGDLKTSEEILRESLSSFERVTILKGWIPDRFSEVSDSHFCFVHIDVDLYQPTRDALNFFYPRLVPGGIILGDDYGFSTCPGARKAFDEFMNDKPESIVDVPTGQAFIIKARET
jgi:O-methyltransferase